MKDYTTLFQAIKSGDQTYPELQRKFHVSSATISELSKMDGEQFSAWNAARQEEAEKLPIRPADAKPLTKEQFEDRAIRKTQDTVIGEVVKQSVENIKQKQEQEQSNDLGEFIKEMRQMATAKMLSGILGSDGGQNKEVEILRRQLDEERQRAKEKELVSEIRSLTEGVKHRDSGSNLNSVLTALISSQASNKDQSSEQMFKFLTMLLGMQKSDQDRVISILQGKNDGIGKVAEEIKAIKEAGELLGLEGKKAGPSTTEIIAGLVAGITDKVSSSPGFNSWLAGGGLEKLPFLKGKLSEQQQAQLAQLQRSHAAVNPQLNTNAGEGQESSVAPGNPGVPAPIDYDHPFTPVISKAHVLSEASNRGVSPGDPAYENVLKEIIAEDSNRQQQERAEKQDEFTRRKQQALEEIESQHLDAEAQKRYLAATQLLKSADDFNVQKIAKNLVNLSSQKD